jgi:hypothetical protein
MPTVIGKAISGGFCLFFFDARRLGVWLEEDVHREADNEEEEEEEDTSDVDSVEEDQDEEEELTGNGGYDSVARGRGGLSVVRDARSCASVRWACWKSRCDCESCVLLVMSCLVSGIVLN